MLIATDRWSLTDIWSPKRGTPRRPGATDEIRPKESLLAPGLCWPTNGYGRDEVTTMLNGFFIQLHGIIELMKSLIVDLYIFAVFVRHLLEMWRNQK
jgi:hypothetical protein